MLANTTWTSQSPTGTIDWQTGTNWSAGTPTLGTVAIVQAPTADQTATVLPGATGQADTLIIGTNGTVQVNAGGTLQVANSIWVDPTGTLRLDQGSTLNAALVNVTGGTLTGPNWPPSRRATLDAATTVRLESGTLAGNLGFTNPSTTAGSYALEVESGGGPGNLIGPTASLRKTTAGAATFSGEVTLNNIRVENGSLTFAHGPALTANNITVTGGSLQSNKNTTVGTLDLQGGTTTLTRATTVTTELRGSGTLIADGSFDIDASSALVNFGGTLRIANSVPATSGNVLINVPAGVGSVPTGALAYYSFNDQANPGQNVLGTGSNGTLMNGAAWAAGGRVSGAISFDGTNDYVSALMNVSETTYGVSLWFKANSDNRGILSVVQGELGGSCDRHINTVGGNVHTRVWSEENLTTTGLAVSDGQWHHVVHTYSQGAFGQRIYVDGVLVASGTKDFSNFNWDDRIQIGYASDAVNDFFHGAIDEVVVYNRPLTQSDVTELYRYGLSGGGARLGNLRLDPDTQLTLGGAGTAKFDSIGATGGLTINSGLTLEPTTSGPANVRGTNSGVHFNAEVNAETFDVTGPGTVSLGKDAVLAIASGGSLKVPQGVTLSANPGAGGNATIDASQASVSFLGNLNVASGRLTLNAPAGSAPLSGAIGYWAMNETGGTTAHDSAGSHNGTLVNMAGTEWTAGVIGNAIRLDGANDYISVPDAADLRITGDIAIAFWYQKTAEAGDWQRIVGKGNTTQRNYGVWEWSGADGRVLFQEYNASGGNILNMDSGALAPGTGTWNHCVATIQGNTAQLYINGQLASTATRTGTPGTSADPLLIGYAGFHTYFPGYLDEVLLYGRALSLQEVQALYAAGLQGGYGGTRFGDLTMAPGTQLVATSQPVGFSTATIGGAVASPTTMTGDFTIDRRVTVTGSGHLLVNGPTGNDGHLRIGDGLVYEWSFRSATNHDLIEVLGDLHFGGSFTLSIFGEGSSIQAGDWIPVFLYSGSLDAPGGLQYTIEIGNLADPRHLYIWDTTNAELFAGLHEGQQGIWLHGLIAHAVPEPGTLSVLALGALALLRRRRRKS